MTAARLAHVTDMPATITGALAEVGMGGVVCARLGHQWLIAPSTR